VTRAGGGPDYVSGQAWHSGNRRVNVQALGTKQQRSPIVRAVLLAWAVIGTVLLVVGVLAVVVTILVFSGVGATVTPH
jgi:hypothetical protein